MMAETAMIWFLRILAAVMFISMSIWAVLQLTCSGWPTVQGTVTRGGWASENRNREFVKYGEYEVAYRYEVNGSAYESERMSWHTGKTVVTVKTPNGGPTAERQPREQDGVTVYYCPVAPSVSVLIPESSPTLWIWSVLTLLVSIALIAWSRLIAHPVF
jgi:hypothetical protein